MEELSNTMELLKKNFFIGVILIGCCIGFVIFSRVYCQDIKKEKAVPPKELSLKTLDGETISISQYKGAKPVMLVFLTTWCGYCRLEMPNINKIYENFKEIEVIGIDPGWNDSIKRLKNFIQRHNVKFKMCFDESGKWGQLYRIRGVPSIVIIDINGDVQYVGNRVPKNLKEQIKSLMKKKEQKNKK